MKKPIDNEAGICYLNSVTVLQDSSNLLFHGGLDKKTRKEDPR